MSKSETQTYLALSDLNFEGYVIPKHTQGALLRYVYNRYSPGSFGRAILAGSMEAAKWAADAENRHCLDEINRWIKDKLPAEMRGSYEAVDDWCYGKD